MAKSISEEELQLRKRARRRLIGAVALVLIVALFLPMVFDGQPKPVEQDISIQIASPNAGTGSVVSTVTSSSVTSQPAAKPEAPRSEEPVTPAPSAETAPEAASKAVQANNTEVPSEKAAPAEPTPSLPKAVADSGAKAAPPTKASSAAAAPQSSEYVIQVAAMGDAKKAKQMQQQMTAAGIKAYLEVVPTKSGDVTRVRAGPYGSRTAAEKARDKLKTLGMAGSILGKTPDKAKDRK